MRSAIFVFRLSCPLSNTVSSERWGWLEVGAVLGLEPRALLVQRSLEEVDHLVQCLPLKTKSGRKNVKSARYRPILSANRRKQRPAHVYARADAAQNGQGGGK